MDRADRQDGLPVAGPVSTLVRAPDALRRSTVDRRTAHTILTRHLPVRDRRWLGLRRRCRHCGQRYPCPPLQAALRHLIDGPP